MQGFKFSGKVGGSSPFFASGLASKAKAPEPPPKVPLGKPLAPLGKPAPPVKDIKSPALLAP
jgi:hypothetical protein